MMLFIAASVLSPFAVTTRCSLLLLLHNVKKNYIYVYAVEKFAYKLIVIIIISSLLP